MEHTLFDIAVKGILYVITIYLLYRLMLAAARKAVREYAEQQNQIKQNEILDEIERDIKEHTM